MDPGSIVFLLTFISLLAILFKNSPALKKHTSALLEMKKKTKPPFIYCGGHAPKDIHAAIIDPSVVIIEANAFRGCTSLQDVKIPSSVKEIRKSAFRDCTSLRDVTFGTYSKFNVAKHKNSLPFVETLTPLSSSGSLHQAVIDTDEEIPPISEVVVSDNNHAAIKGNSSPSPISEVVLNNTKHNVIMGTSIFRDCISLQSVVLPPTLIQIPKSMFQGCTSLSTIMPPLFPALEKVGIAAFDGCASLRSVSFLPRVKKIGICAFNGCENLEIAEVLSIRTGIGKYAFAACPKLEYLPVGYLNEKGRPGNNEICSESEKSNV